MSAEAYIPSGGLAGKVKRQLARRLARAPLAIPAGQFVSFTFDDFPKSAVDTGADQLEKRGWRGTWYAATGFMNGDTHHGAMFDAGDIARLADAGHEIACHTTTHLDAASAPLAVTLEDASANTQALESLGVEITNFAFPYGEATPAVKRALGARYDTLRGVQPGINRDGADRHLLKAVGIDGGDTGIVRALDWLNKLGNEPGWLIYYIHDVQQDPTEWGCTPAQLEQVCDAVAQSGVKVLPVNAVLERLATV